MKYLYLKLANPELGKKLAAAATILGFLSHLVGVSGLAVFGFLPTFNLGPFALLPEYEREAIRLEETLAKGPLLATIQGTAFLAVGSPQTPKTNISPISGKRLVVVTAYSSTPDQTDHTPFITANGATVRDGIVAANFLPFGTKLRVPKLFGEKIFTVEDRMHPRFSNTVDIWFETREQAKHFGVKVAEVEIL